MKQEPTKYKFGGEVYSRQKEEPLEWTRKEQFKILEAGENQVHWRRSKTSVAGGW